MVIFYFSSYFYDKPNGEFGFFRACLAFRKNLHTIDNGRTQKVYEQNENGVDKKWLDVLCTCQD